MGTHYIIAPDGYIPNSVIRKSFSNRQPFSSLEEDVQWQLNRKYLAMVQEERSNNESPTGSERSFAAGSDIEGGKMNGRSRRRLRWANESKVNSVSSKSFEDTEEGLRQRVDRNDNRSVQSDGSLTTGVTSSPNIDHKIHRKALSSVGSGTSSDDGVHSMTSDGESSNAELNKSKRCSKASQRDARAIGRTNSHTLQNDERGDVGGSAEREARASTVTLVNSNLVLSHDATLSMRNLSTHPEESHIRKTSVQETLSENNRDEQLEQIYDKKSEASKDELHKANISSVTVMDRSKIVNDEAGPGRSSITSADDCLFGTVDISLTEFDIGNHDDPLIVDISTADKRQNKLSEGPRHIRFSNTAADEQTEDSARDRLAAEKTSSGDSNVLELSQKHHVTVFLGTRKWTSSTTTRNRSSKLLPDNPEMYRMYKKRSEILALS